MDIRPIRTDRDHSAALAEIEQLWGASEHLTTATSAKTIF